MKTTKFIAIFGIAFLLINCTNKKTEKQIEDAESIAEVIEVVPVEKSLYEKD